MKQERHPFPPTRWSLLARAAGSDELDRLRALEIFLDEYSPALRSFLVNAMRLPEPQADELMQDFVLDKILARKLLERADRSKGRFRSYIAKALSNFARSRLDAGNRKAIDGLDEFIENTTLDAEAADLFDREWTRCLVEDALDLMRRDCEEKGRLDVWQIFCMRVVDPLLAGSATVEYGTIVERLGLTSPRQAINLLATAKRAFERHLRVAIGRYVTTDQGIDEELEELRAVFAR